MSGDITVTGEGTAIEVVAGAGTVLDVVPGTTTIDVGPGVVVVNGGGGGGVTDHGALTGLSDNDHPQYALKASNLSDLASASTARTNLGLGTAATQATGAFDAAGAAAAVMRPLVLAGVVAGTVTVATLEAALASSPGGLIFALGLQYIVVGHDTEAPLAVGTASAVTGGSAGLYQWDGTDLNYLSGRTTDAISRNDVVVWNGRILNGSNTTTATWAPGIGAVLQVDFGAGALPTIGSTIVDATTLTVAAPPGTGNLTAAVTNVQAFLDEVDALTLGGGGGAVDSVDGRTGVVTLSDLYDAAGAAAAAAAASQPLDSDLTAIAALTTTSYGRAFLGLADAAAARTALALGTAATAATGDFQPIDSDLTSIAALTTTAFGRALLELADAAAGRAALGVESVSAFYGTGTDGDVTISGATTLTNDMYYDDLVVTGTLTTNGYRVFVAGTLSGNGTITCAGASATSQSGGTAGGVSTAAPVIKGVDGGAGTTTSGLQAAAGTTTQLGNTGGAGGSGASGGSTAARAVSQPGQSAGGIGIINDLIQIRQGSPVGPSPTRFAGGMGGSGGSGDGTNTGGGAGGGGGICMVFARYVTFTGTITAAGGNGATRSSGNVGGGGGGGGGFAMLCTASTSVPCTVTAAGGAAGSGVGTGTAGTAGSAGYTRTYLGVR